MKQEWEILTDQKAFARAAIEAVKALGATPDTEFPWLERYNLETRAGTLRVLPVPATDGEGGFIALRFIDVERAKQLLPNGLNLNRYSGKWNLHLFGVKDPTAIKRDLTNHLRRVM